MSVRLHIRDFQSIKDAEVVVDGFTVITGPNNSGKTAVQRAVSGVFSNPGGDAYVRHGTEKFSVEVGFTDGNTVRWEKGPKTKPTYVLNGKTIYPGRAVPEEVLDLGIRPIQAGTGQVWPQLAQQFTGQVFLLDMPGSSAAEAVADVDRVGKLTQALRLAETDKRSASSEVKVRRQDVVKAKEDLSDYDGVEVVTAHVRGLEKSLDAVVVLSKEVQDSQGARQQLLQAKAGVRAFAGFTPNCIGEDLVPESRGLVTKLTVARRLKGQVEAGRASVLNLSGIRGIEVPDAPPAVGDMASQLAIARQLRGALAPAQVIAETTRRAVTVIRGVDLETAGGASVKAQKVEAALGVYKSMQARLAQGNKNVAILRDLLKKKSADLTDTENEVGVTLGSLGSCPVCRTPSTGSPHSH